MTSFVNYARRSRACIVAGRTRILASFRERASIYQHGALAQLGRPYQADPSG